MNKKSMLNLIKVATMISLTGCAYSVHQVHTGDFTPFSRMNKGRKIHAQAEQFVILGFVGNVDFVKRAYEELQAKCPNKKIVGITTEHVTHLGFFSWTNKVHMRGRCV